MKTRNQPPASGEVIQRHREMTQPGGLDLHWACISGSDFDRLRGDKKTDVVD